MTHPNWVQFRDLAKRADLRACWSEPIKSASGETLGTFALYYREPREPNEAELKRIVGAIRAKWPGVSMLIRGDSGFCRGPIMAWCDEEEGVDYLLGMAKNKRLLAANAEELAQAKARFAVTALPARLFKD